MYRQGHAKSRCHASAGASCASTGNYIIYTNGTQQTAGLSTYQHSKLRESICQPAHTQVLHAGYKAVGLTAGSSMRLTGRWLRSLCLLACTPSRELQSLDRAEPSFSKMHCDSTLINEASQQQHSNPCTRCDTGRQVEKVQAALACCGKKSSTATNCTEEQRHVQLQLANAQQGPCSSRQYIAEARCRASAGASWTSCCVKERHGSHFCAKSSGKTVSAGADAAHAQPPAPAAAWLLVRQACQQ